VRSPQQSAFDSSSRAIRSVSGLKLSYANVERAISVRGRLSGPTRIDLDEPVEDISGEVEVVIRQVEATAAPQRDIFDVLSSLPPGTRSKEDIDRQIAEERDSWNNDR
jgi:hypothetical protein